MSPITIPEVIDARPPNFEEILAAFPGAGNPGVIFAYGEKIYYPQCIRGLAEQVLPSELIAHELVHCNRQIEIGVEDWWFRYINDPEFRYEEELLAHRAEYYWLASKASTRQLRRGALKRTAKRLAAPLYRTNISVSRAKKDILA